MKKKHYRVQLFPHETETGMLLIKLAAKHNSGTMPVKDIYALKLLGETYLGVIKNEGRSEELNFEIIGETQLCLDVKYKGIWYPSAVIEEVEVFEPVRENDFEDDDLKADILAASKYPETH